MRVLVRFYSVFEKVTGRREWVAQVKQGATLKELLKMLFKEFGPAFKELVVSGEWTVKTSCVVLLNGQNVILMEGLDTPLKDGDEIWLLPPLSGG